MQYLKLYEDFYKPIISNCNSVDNAFPVEKIVSIDNKAISAVDKLGLECIKKTASLIPDLGNLDYFTHINQKKIFDYVVIYIKNDSDTDIIEIWQYEDEWFRVSTFNDSVGKVSYYRCDQIEGLIECLLFLLKNQKSK